MAIFGILVSAYVRGDQVAGVIRTKELPKGERVSGNRKKLIQISLLVLALTAESAIFQIIFQSESPTQGFFLIFMSCVTCLIAGEKGKTT